MSYASFFLAFLLGIAFSAPPGLINIESMRQGLKGGFGSALAVGMGSLIGDGAYAVIAFGGLDFLIKNNAAKFTVGFVGVVFLIYLAVSAFRVKNMPKTEENTTDNKKNQVALVSGMVLSLTNPWAFAFWLSFGGILISSGISADSQNLWRFLAAFLAGVVSWVIVFSGLVAFGKKFISDKIFHAVSFASGVIFLGTAGYAIWQLAVI